MHSSKGKLQEKLYTLQMKLLTKSNNWIPNWPWLLIWAINMLDCGWSIRTLERTGDVFFALGFPWSEESLRFLNLLCEDMRRNKLVACLIDFYTFTGLWKACLMWLICGLIHQRQHAKLLLIHSVEEICVFVWFCEQAKNVFLFVLHKLTMASYCMYVLPPVPVIRSKNNEDRIHK